MTQESKKVGKHTSDEHGFSAYAMGTGLDEHTGMPFKVSMDMPSGGSINKTGVHFHIMTKKDIEKELAQTKEIFDMTPEEFYEAWRRNEFHGFQAMKLGCLYELYKDEYE